MTETTNTYYLSDNVSHVCDPIIVTFTLDHNTFPYVIEAPDPSIQQPKFDWGQNKWVEIKPDAQAQQIATLQTQVQSLQTSLTASQAADEASQQAIVALTKQLVALQAAKTEAK